MEQIKNSKIFWQWNFDPQLKTLCLQAQFIKAFEEWVVFSGKLYGRGSSGSGPWPMLSKDLELASGNKLFSSYIAG